MNALQLDERLANDCHVLGRLHDNLLLLMDDARLPWFILVPDTSARELCDMDTGQQQQLLLAINQLSEHVRQQFNPDKLNIATIGNIVSQMHVHIIGRYHDDHCWPEPVWGKPGKTSYQAEEVERITGDLEQQLGADFTAIRD